MQKIGFGGGCHWCTEAVFQQVLGVDKVQQGWIASSGLYQDFSEAVIVYFNPTTIELEILVGIHLSTHSCTALHKMREKYRSAIYYFEEGQKEELEEIMTRYKLEFDDEIITQVLPFSSFKENVEKYQNYYLKNAEGQFCQRYIHPKMETLRQKFSKYSTV